MLGRSSRPTHIQIAPWTRQNPSPSQKKHKKARNAKTQNPQHNAFDLKLLRTKTTRRPTHHIRPQHHITSYHDAYNTIEYILPTLCHRNTPHSTKIKLNTSILQQYTMENNRFLVLISSTFATGKQMSDQSRSISMLQSLRFAFDVVDGSDLSNKEM